MHYPEIQPLTFLKILEKNANNPIYLEGTDGHMYYAKFPRNKTDHNLLAFEFLGHELAKHFGIKTPEAAIISYTPKDFEELPNYYRFYHEHEYGKKVYGFASKEVENSIDLSTLHDSRFNNKKQASRFKDPYQLLRIILFDIHLFNIDRTINNYNLLLHTSIGSQFLHNFFAIDHMGFFGGPSVNLALNPNNLLDVRNTLLKSGIFYSLCKYYNIEAVRNEIDAYFNRCNQDMVNIVNQLFTKISSFVAIDTALGAKVANYLCATGRNERIKKVVLEGVLNLMLKAQTR